MHLHYEPVGKRYVLHCSYQQRHVAKRARLTWDGRCWSTCDPQTAMNLFQYATPSTRLRLADIAQEFKAAREASFAIEPASPLEIPRSPWMVEHGVDYYPYQKAGILYALTHRKVLLADAPGLGKSCQAIGVVNLLPQTKNLLVICPASLKINWARELERWLIKDWRIEIYDPHGSRVVHHGAWGRCVIINYNLLKKYSPMLTAQPWEILIADECHAIKNPESIRSQYLQRITADRELFLSGSPIINHPKDLYPIVHRLAPHLFPNFHTYGMEFCGAHQESFRRDEDGMPIKRWIYDGASNLDRLQDTLRTTMMVRRLKADVPLELPRKIREVVLLEDRGFLRLLKREQKLLQRYERVRRELHTTDKSFQRRVQQLRSHAHVAFQDLARVRHDTAVAKVPACIQHIEQMAESVEKILVFAHHHDVLTPMQEHFGDRAVIVWGLDKNLTRRQQAVDRFQHDPKVQIFLGNIESGGIGLNLTKAPLVIFVELDWRPAMMLQAEDRAHRIGNEHESVLIQHLVVDGSLDSRIAQRLIEKQAVADQALDAAMVPTTLDDLLLSTG